MSESELLNQILAELKKINTELQNIKDSVESNHELLTHRIGVLESILDKIRINTQ